MIQKFAGYGFNKSHAAAYAVVCYHTGYLKAHYPTEFMAALMTTDMGNADKIVGYFTECRDLDIKVLGPDVNESQKNFTVVDGAIRFGLAAIKNVGEGAVGFGAWSSVPTAGRFTSFFDFCRRVDLHKVNKRMLEGLIKAGAFDSLGAKRSQLMAVLDQAIEDGAAAQQERDVGPDQHLRRRSQWRRSCARSHANPPCRTCPNGIRRAVEIRTRTHRLLYYRPPAGAL